MTDLISFPFRVGPNGAIVTRPDDSDDYYAELIGQMVLTTPGEREQAPLFGLSDPTFSEIDAQELIYKIGLFGPPVRVLGVTTKFVSDRHQDVLVEFAPLDVDMAEPTNIITGA